MRRLLSFFVLGALLLLGKRSLLEPRAELRTLQVDVKASASTAELERAIDEAILIEQAIAAGGALVDPLVREQLLSSMRDRSDCTQSEDDAALLAQALALGLHRADQVTRQRLVFQAEQLLMAGSTQSTESERELRDYLTAHASRYALEPRYSFVQITLSSRRGVAGVADAERLLDQLRREQTSEAEAVRLGDPTLLPHVWSSASASALDGRFGAGFSRALAELPEGSWSGPIASAYGLHLIQLRARTGRALPALGTVRARVLSDYRHDLRRELLRERLRMLRRQYHIDLRRRRA
ncbi:MAG: hypothetical protein JWN48_3888 [Myxococcaceae bacterium]|nr:hypothetical protein [Myxococcaceae bacterium]